MVLSSVLSFVFSQNNDVMQTTVKKDGTLFPFGNGCHLDVEYSGLEPLTSTLPVSRSSQMS